MLRGRRAECEALDRLLGVVRAGESRVLVVRGEPGVGKTALLEYLVERAAGFQVLRASGVQSEMELPFAGLHLLCAPMLDRLDRLPAPQRDALGTAFGLSAGAAPDRLFVGLAVLGLMAEAAEDPLLCVVDDAQWLDRASAQALAVAARRLLAEPVALIFAARESERELAGLPELVVGGLDEPDARALLGSVIAGPLDERVGDRIVAETRGNPLALLELPRGLTAAELAGGFGLPDDSVALSGRIEESFRRRLEQLPADSRRLLVVAAAEPVGESRLLWRAARRLGIAGEAAAPAEAAGLCEFGTRVRFRHPLVRSAVYRAASRRERQDVHRALAEATDAALDPDRRAWHRAQAAPGPDEDVAQELERTAGRAHSRGGLAAAAALLERAAALTLDPARRAERALAAAQAKLEAGAPNAALQLLATAQGGPADELLRARIDALRGQVAFAVNRGREAPPLLLQAAARLEPLDPRLARETYLDAFAAALFAGRLAGDGDLLAVAEAARAAGRTATASQPTRAIDLLLDGLALRMAEGPAAAKPLLVRALSTFRAGDLAADETRWLWLAAGAAFDRWDDETWDVLSTRHVQLARDAGALTVLPLALTTRVLVHLLAGELGAAAALVDEVDAIIDATGSHLAPFGALLVAAWQGREARAAELVEAVRHEAETRGEGLGLTTIHWATTVLSNALGRYDEALDAARRAYQHPHELGLATRVLPELIEAAARGGKPEQAGDALQRLSESTRAGGTDWALGIDARSRALLSDGDAADALYREAIDRLGRSRAAVALARTHLVYGEWLRRERRRVDAREQLRTAHGMLATMGLEAFAARAGRELLATGETARKRTLQTSDQLTAQEAHIARLARDGLSNPEIAGRLFISPRTVEYHLHKVFTKLEISSRNELTRVLAGDLDAAPIRPPGPAPAPEAQAGAAPGCAG